MNRALTILGTLLLAAAAGSCRPYSADEDDGPEQPIAFYHKVHAGAVADGGNAIPCMYCHYTADRSVSAGIPSVQLCVGCHVPGSSNPAMAPANASLAYPSAARDSTWNAEATKLVDYWKRQESIPWVKVHNLPDHVTFPHYMHVNAGLQCQTCHGKVEEMKTVFQANSLRMGWCVSCHRGETPLTPEEEATVRQRSSFIRHFREQRAAGVDVRGQLATYPNQRASVDCTVCHY
jgi:hypothetical protein